MCNRLCIHATTVSLNGSAVIIRGPSGSGKSDLALQLIEGFGTGLSHETLHARLVADDQTELRRQGACIHASAPASIRGLLEIRGIGIVTVSCEDNVPVVLVVDLKPGDSVERMPLPDQCVTSLLDVKVALVAIDGTKPSAAARLRTAWAIATRNTVRLS